MNKKLITLISILLVWSVKTYAQIPSGLYVSHSYGVWYVVVKNDTAFTERLSEKKGFVHIWGGSRDTLIQQNDKSYIGKRYQLSVEANKLFIIKTPPLKKGEKYRKLKPAKQEDKREWDMLRNMLVLNELLYKKPNLKKIMFGEVRGAQYEYDELREAYWNLEGLCGVDQVTFIQKVDRFKETYLKELPPL
ncbi:MAG: hypothetical protein KDC07_03325 [Chitinophagaceae bacterium]|nr:hypothetical protein [Chitinophagaceae bacterium]MCB9047516.1 hypothetical protein [Chitinophagales bacterium]